MTEQMDLVLQGLGVQAAVVASAAWAGAALAGRLGLGRLAGAMASGLVLSVAVAGRYWPEGYRMVFEGGRRAVALTGELERWQAERAEARRRLVATGVSEAAVEDFDRVSRQRAEQLEEELAALEGGYRRGRWLLLYGCGLFWLVGAGWSVGLGRRSHGLAESLPLAAGAVVGVVVVSAVLMGLVGRWWPQFGRQSGLPSDWQGLVGWAAAGLGVALPAGNGLMGRLRRRGGDGPVDDLGELAGGVGGWLVLAGFGVMAAGGAVVQAGQPVERALGVAVGAVMAVTVLMVGLVGPVLRWSMVRWGRGPTGATLAVALGVAVAAVLARWVGLSVLWVAVVVAVGLSWTAGGGEEPGGQDEGAGGGGRGGAACGLLPMAGLMAGALAVMEVDVLEQVHWVGVLAALVVMGDSKAVGMMLAGRWWGRLSWGGALRVAVVMAEGGPAMVMLLVGLYHGGLLSGVQYGSMLWAVGVLSAVGRAMAAMADHLVMADRPEG